jgi:AcrR family transcriptional regulator
MPATIDIPQVENLLDAALTTFDALGYSATPVPTIAGQAGMAVGSVYRYFPSKEELANALYRREKQRLAEALFTELDIDAPAEEVFTSIWGRLADFAVEHTEALSFLELHHHGAYLDSESRDLAGSIDARIAALVLRWQERGEIRAGDPLLLHAQVFGGFVAVLRQVRTGGLPVTRAVGMSTLEPAWGLLRPTSGGSSA